jgi:hypothetical protein
LDVVLALNCRDASESSVANEGEMVTLYDDVIVVVVVVVGVVVVVVVFIGSQLLVSSLHSVPEGQGLPE